MGKKRADSRDHRRQRFKMLMPKQRPRARDGVPAHKIDRDDAAQVEQRPEIASIMEAQRPSTCGGDEPDAVTQTLFSTSLIADVLPRLWERDQPEARRRLDELRQSTRGALAEMRARFSALVRLAAASLARWVMPAAWT